MLANAVWLPGLLVAFVALGYAWKLHAESIVVYPNRNRRKYV